MSDTDTYPVRLTIDYPEKMDRVTTLVRLITVLPILVILGLASGWVATDSGGQNLVGLLYIAVALMIIFCQRYPRWWFDFIRELARFTGRVFCYLLLLTDRYPSTVDEQSYHLEIDYPDVKSDLNRWMPLIKWLLALPHYVILVFLGVATIIVTIVAWFAILITGSYPRPLFDFTVGVFRWSARVMGYAFWLVTDQYPPFRMT
ncbi:MAG: DUF4389 domain-containing protein [Paracoccaceae bacterium]|nr:DUF4389 domain-containing protein [Paracoccaceae bacterium]